MRVVQRAREQLTAALIAGNERLCRQIAIDLYLAEHSLSVICDDVFAAAFQQIGERWACGEAEVYQEPPRLRDYVKSTARVAFDSSATA